MNVKAQGLLNCAAWVREKHGPEALDRVLAECRPAVRDRVATAIAINWIPYDDLADLLGAADRVLGSGEGKVAEGIGAASARKSLHHLGLRLAFFLGHPEFLMRRVAGVWRQFNDRGEMQVRDFRDGQMVAELVGIPRPDWFVCCSVSGWLYEAGLATGMRLLTATHVECRAKGAPRCTWNLRWTAGRAAPRGA